MIYKCGFIAGFIACGLLAGCVEDTGSSNDRLSGTQIEFAQMKNPCISQASRMTGVPANQIVVTNEIRTGGGPLLVLNVRGTSLSCRTESDGSVTVFSEFAN